MRKRAKLRSEIKSHYLYVVGQDESYDSMTLGPEWIEVTDLKPRQEWRVKDGTLVRTPRIIGTGKPWRSLQTAGWNDKCEVMTVEIVSAEDVDPARYDAPWRATVRFFPENEDYDSLWGCDVYFSSSAFQELLEACRSGEVEALSLGLGGERRIKRDYGMDRSTWVLTPPLDEESDVPAPFLGHVAEVQWADARRPLKPDPPEPEPEETVPAPPPPEPVHPYLVALGERLDRVRGGVITAGALVAIAIIVARFI